MKKNISYVLILVSLVIFGFRIAENIKFKQNVSGYLKRAADANTIDLANQELSKAITYLESNNMTSGYTSIFYKTPDEDVDFWYRNLKASQNELQNLNSESALEKTNVLIKLRETLMDGGEKSKVTVPKGLSVYPNNAMWSVLMTVALVCLGYGFVLFAIEADKRAKEKISHEKE
jgi:hypothetical protein